MSTDSGANRHALAQHVFEAHPDVASVSVVSRALADAHGADRFAGERLLQATAATLPTCFLNSAVAGLIGTRASEANGRVSMLGYKALPL